MKAISQVLWIALLGVAVLVSSYPIDNHPHTDLEDLLLLARLEKESEEFNNDIDGSSEEVIRNPSTILLPPPVPESKEPSEPVQPIETSVPETITEVNPPSTDGVQIDDEMNTPDVLILIATPASVINEDPELNPSTDAVLQDDKEPPKAEILIYTLPSGLASEDSTTPNPDGSVEDEVLIATTDKASGISEDEEALATTPLPDLSVPSVISSDPETSHNEEEEVLADPATAVGVVSATEKEEILISTPQPENDDGLSSDTTEKGSGAEDDTLHHEEGPSAVLNNLANDAEESQHSTPLVNDPDVPEGTTLLPTVDDLTADDEHHTESSATDGSPIVQQDETTEVSITDPTTKEPTVAPPSASHHTTKEPY